MLPRRDVLLGGTAIAAALAGFPAFAGKKTETEEDAIDPRMARIIRVGRKIDDTRRHSHQTR